MKKQIGSFVAGAVSTGGIPASYGITNWRVIAGAAAAGGICALFGVNVPALTRTLKAKLTARKTKAAE